MKDTDEALVIYFNKYRVIQDQTGNHITLSNEIINHLLDEIRSALSRARADEREQIIARFKNEWVGDDYHGETIEKIIREMANL